MDGNKLFLVNPNKSRGFGLITLILIIAVVGTIISYHVITLQQKAREQKIEKTALEIKIILQAVLAYYGDQGVCPLSDYERAERCAKWREDWCWQHCEHVGRSGRCLDPCDPPACEDQRGNKKALVQYVPFADESTVDKYTYNDSSVAADCTITTKAPVPNAVEVAALLPNATVDKDQKISIQLSPTNLSPIDKHINQPIIVQDIRVVRISTSDFDGGGKQNSPSVIEFSCPGGYTGKQLAAPQSFWLGRKKCKDFMPTIKKIGLDKEPECAFLGGGKFRCASTFVFRSQMCGSSGTVGEECSVAGRTFGNLAGLGPCIDMAGYVSLLLMSYCEKNK